MRKDSAPMVSNAVMRGIIWTTAKASVMAEPTMPVILTPALSSSRANRSAETEV